MLHVALWEPEIPPNTGNIARLCAATGSTLHLIGRLGFRLDDRTLLRAGLDYWPTVNLHQHVNFEAFQAAVVTPQSSRLFCFSAHAAKSYTAIRYQPGDVLLFGSESRGLPQSLLDLNPEQTITIPMLTQNVRSLNLATAVGIALYEGLRQLQNW
jgi:tRNA (cytidine/uridine-2'-O-)-methyltransferase